MVVGWVTQKESKTNNDQLVVINALNAGFKAK